MKIERHSSPSQWVAAIQQSGLSIYDPIAIGDPTLWIPTPELQTILDDELRGLSLAGLPLRTRSKVVKEQICRALGYPIPKSFKKTQPRFVGQGFDVYTQKSNNLQVWNEELEASRRYVLIRVSDADVVTRVKVITGDTLALLDTTGTLTQKYQARCTDGQNSELVSSGDTAVLAPLVNVAVALDAAATPVAQPKYGELLPIAEVYRRLRSLENQTFENVGSDQERKRGEALLRLVCQALGYRSFADDGQFPDVRHQLIEVKLQLAPTIDLGLVRPDSIEPVDVPMIEGAQIRHCDVRYAIFTAEIDGPNVRLKHLLLTTGEDSLAAFPSSVAKCSTPNCRFPCRPISSRFKPERPDRTLPKPSLRVRSAPLRSSLDRTGCGCLCTKR